MTSSNETSFFASSHPIENSTKTALTSKVLTTNRKRKTKYCTEKHQHSIEKSMLSPIEQELGVNDLFGGEIKHLSFDIPKNLITALNSECKLNGESVCKVLVKSASLYVVTSRIKKHALGDTLSKLLDSTFTIGEMNFTQNCQTRPRRLIRRNVQVSLVSPENETVQFCEVSKGNCKNPAIDILIYQPKDKDPLEFRVCLLHSVAYSKSLVWRFKQKIENQPRGEA
jgi:hypothetical protein